MDFFTSNRRASLALREMVDDLMDALLDDRMGVQTEALIHALIHAGLNFLGNVWVGFGKPALIDDLIKDLIDALINFQTDDLMHTLIEALINFRIEASIRVSFNTWISAPIYTFPTLRSMILCVFDQPPKNTLQLFSSAMTSDPGQKQWVDKGRCSVRPQKDQAATTPPPDVWFSASPWGEGYNKDQDQDYNQDQDYDKDQDQGEDYNKDQGEDQGSGWRTHRPYGDLCALAVLLFLGCQ